MNYSAAQKWELPVESVTSTDKMLVPLGINRGCMWNVFENSWLLLTLAGVALVAAGIWRQAKPEHGRKPLLVPLVLVLLGFGLDAAVRTDYEAIEHIVRSCRAAALKRDHQAILRFVSSNYADSIHKNKAQLEAAAESILQRASVHKVRMQSHVITINGTQAQSEFAAAVHLGAENEYTKGVSLVFVGLEFDFEKIGKKWFIQRVEVTSVNYQPMDWNDVR